jgi:hypothetical protein
MNDAIRLPRRTLAVAATVLALFGARPLAAQSLFSTGGLGLIADPQDARGAALGGTSLGFPGAELSWDNPAGAVGLPAAGLRVSFQLDGFNADFAGRSSEASTARFPLLLGAFPFGSRWAVTAGFAGFLDQNWAFEERDTLVIGADSVEVLDRISSEGGASRFRLGAAYRLLPSLSLGLGAELFTGGAERVSGRIFPGQNSPACCSASWTYSGAGVLGSLDWTPSEAVTVAASASAGGSLDADATSGTDAVDRSYDLPVLFNVGATGRVASSVLVTLGGQWGGWSSLNEALVNQGGARDSWSLQGGVEAEAFQIFGQPVPLRIGARTERLPFRFLGVDNEWANETAFTGGSGLVLGGGAARLDVSVERGSRGSEAAGLEESYWRLLFSATVLGR